MYCKLYGNGRGSFATLRLSKLHMLSYEITTFLMSSLVVLAKAVTIQDSTIKNTCAGPSDLNCVLKY